MQERSTPNYVGPRRALHGFGGAGFFSGFRGLGRAEKVRLIRKDGSLPLARKCALAGVSRSRHYEPRPVDAETLALQRLVGHRMMDSV